MLGEEQLAKLAAAYCVGSARETDRARAGAGTGQSGASAGASTPTTQRRTDEQHPTQQDFRTGTGLVPQRARPTGSWAADQAAAADSASTDPT